MAKVEKEHSSDSRRNSITGIRTTRYFYGTVLDTALNSALFWRTIRPGFVGSLTVLLVQVPGSSYSRGRSRMVSSTQYFHMHTQPIIPLSRSKDMVFMGHLGYLNIRLKIHAVQITIPSILRRTG